MVRSVREGKRLEGEWEMGLLLPWEGGLPNVVEGSSCESDLDGGSPEISII